MKPDGGPADSLLSSPRGLRDRYVQRAVDVEVDIAAFVSKIARSAVLTRVEVHEGGQIRIHGVGPAVRYLGVHGGLCIEMRRRIHPNDIEVSGVLRARSDSQRIFQVRRVHLATQ